MLYKEVFFMQKNTQGTRNYTRTLIFAALLTALSIIFGKLLKIPIGNSLRISFESLPVLIASLMLGPFWGAGVGICADIIGCLVVGYSINPFITLGCMTVGVLPYFFNKLFKFNTPVLRIAASVLLTHIIASMIIKSLGLYIWYQTPVSVLALRVPIYMGTAIAEALIITGLDKSGVMKKVI